jgi:hypothetical protein
MVGRLAIVFGGVLLVASLVSPVSQAATQPGFGKAQAGILMLDPRSAQLSFGVRFGPTVSDHRNQVARAQAQSTDYGLIGSALTGSGCDGGDPFVRSEDLPKPMRADSRNPKDLAEREVSEGPITQSVQADPRPYARATSRLLEASLPGIAEVGASATETISGVDDEGVPLVRAIADITSLSIAGGVVRLGGLHWEAQQHGDDDPTGRFTIGSAAIGGVPVPTQDASALVQAVNAVLSQLGVVMTPPVTHVEDDTIFVDPIKVGIAPNQTRDLIAGQTLAALQPAREALFQVLLDSSCNSGAAITVADILLGSITGGGSLTAVIGGAQAQFIPPAPGVSFGGDADTGGGPTLGDAGGFRGSGAFQPGTGGAAVAAPGTSTTEPSTRPASVHTSFADDHAVPVALLALLLGGLLVEADRRKMRQAGVAVSTLPSTEGPG